MEIEKNKVINIKLDAEKTKRYLSDLTILYSEIAETLSQICNEISNLDSNEWCPYVCFLISAPKKLKAKLRSAIYEDEETIYDVFDTYSEEVSDMTCANGFCIGEWWKKCVSYSVYEIPCLDDDDIKITFVINKTCEDYDDYGCFYDDDDDDDDDSDFYDDDFYDDFYDDDHEGMIDIGDGVWCDDDGDNWDFT